MQRGTLEFCTLGLFLVALASATAEEPKRLLLIGQGPDGHPPATHEFMAGLQVIKAILGNHPSLSLRSVKADEPWPEGPSEIDRADGVVLFVTQGARFAAHDPARLAAFQRLVFRGGGVVGLHWAIGCKDAEYIPPFLAILGGCHGGPDRKYTVLESPQEVRPANSSHPITAGISPFQARDEFYHHLKFVTPGDGLLPVLKTKIEGEDQTIAWSWERPDGGRSFGFSGLHFHDNWRLVEYRRLVSQAVLWTLSIPVPSDGLEVDVSADVLALP
jgi:type 1 glutamine amidotransferase